MRDIVIAWAVCALLAIGTHAAQPHLAPAGQLDLPRFVDLAAERVGVRIEYDPAVLKGTLTLRLPDSLTPDELWSLTNHTLATRGFTTIRLPGSNAYSVVRLSEAAGLAAVRSDSWTGPAPGFVTEVVPLSHRAPKEVIESVKLVLSKPGGNVAALGDSRSIVISDLTARVDEAKRLVAVLDAPGSGAAVEEYATIHLAPAQLAALVAQVAAKREAVSGQKFSGEIVAGASGSSVLLIAPPAAMPEWRDLVQRLDQRPPVETVTYSPSYFAASEVGSLIEQSVRDAGAVDDRWRLVVDELTGSLIITATPSQHERIAALIARLDSQPAGASRPVRSFPVRNRPVNELVSTLTQLIAAGALEVPDTAGDRAAVTGAAQQRTLRDVTSPVGTAPLLPEPSPAPPAASTSPSDGNAPEFTLTADEATNTLIAIGEPRLLSQLEDLIAMLDVRQPQVMLEVMLVSLNDSDSVTLGVELERLGEVGSSLYRLASLFGLSTATAGIRTVGDAAGFSGVVLDPGEFSVVVRALQVVNEGRTTSTPKLLVTNNEQATFTSVLQQPVLTTLRDDNSTTTSYGGTEDAGTTISVRPQIAQGDHLVLTYSIKLSAFVGAAAAEGLPPPKQQNSVDSVATIPDGHTVVVGGLELITDTDGASQVPILGDIPLLGYLFKSQTNATSRARFFVFIRASVMRHQNFEDLKYVSVRDSNAVGIDDGFPEVLPRVIK
jgi:type II secretory pathway component GspD/PulD (secretin)